MLNAAFTYAAFVVGRLAGVTRYTVRRDRRNKGTLVREMEAGEVARDTSRPPPWYTRAANICWKKAASVHRECTPATPMGGYETTGLAVVNNSTLAG